MQLRSRRSRHSGGRTSLDSLAYSSEGSPASGRRSCKGNAKSTTVGTIASLPAQVLNGDHPAGNDAKIPDSMRAWLDDDASSSNDDTNRRITLDVGLPETRGGHSNEERRRNLLSPGCGTVTLDSRLHDATCRPAEFADTAAVAAAAAMSEAAFAGEPDLDATPAPDGHVTPAVPGQKIIFPVDIALSSPPIAAAATRAAAEARPAVQRSVLPPRRDHHDSGDDVPQQAAGLAEGDAEQHDLQTPLQGGDLTSKSLKPTTSAADEMKRWLSDSDDEENIEATNSSGGHAPGGAFVEPFASSSVHQAAITADQRRPPADAVPDKTQNDIFRRSKLTLSAKEEMVNWLSESDEEKTGTNNILEWGKGGEAVGTAARSNIHVLQPADTMNKQKQRSAEARPEKEQDASATCELSASATVTMDLPRLENNEATEPEASTADRSRVCATAAGTAAGKAQQNLTQRPDNEDRCSKVSQSTVDEIKHWLSESEDEMRVTGDRAIVPAAGVAEEKAVSGNRRESGGNVFESTGWRGRKSERSSPNGDREKKGNRSSLSPKGVNGSATGRRSRSGQSRSPKSGSNVARGASKSPKRGSPLRTCIAEMHQDSTQSSASGGDLDFDGGVSEEQGEDYFPSSGSRRRPPTYYRRRNTRSGPRKGRHRRTASNASGQSVEGAEEGKEAAVGGVEADDEADFTILNECNDMKGLRSVTFVLAEGENADLTKSATVPTGDVAIPQERATSGSRFSPSHTWSATHSASSGNDSSVGMDCGARRGTGHDGITMRYTSASQIRQACAKHSRPALPQDRTNNPYFRSGDRGKDGGSISEKGIVSKVSGDDGFVSDHFDSPEVSPRESGGKPRKYSVRNVRKTISRAKEVVSRGGDAAASGSGEGGRKEEIKVEITPPLLGKFQGLVLDNRDLEDLARWLPRPAEPSAGTGDRRLHMDDGGTVVPTERKSPRGNGLSTMLLAALASGGEAVGVDGPMSPTGLSIFSSDSNTTYAEEVNDFLLECTDDSMPGVGSDGRTLRRHPSSIRFSNIGATESTRKLHKKQVDVFFRSSSEECSSVSSVNTDEEANAALRRRWRETRERLPSLPLALQSLPKEDQLYMQRNFSARKGLEAVIGLNFAALPAEVQLNMVKAMEITRYSKGDEILREGEECRGLYVVLGAPKELLAVGEVPAVEVISEPMFSPGSVSSAVSGGGEGEGMRRRCHRLLEGQYFGEKALFRKEVAKATVVAASSVVDCASVSVSNMDAWEPFRLYLLMKDVPLLTKLPTGVLNSLMQTMRHQTFSPGENIVRQGDPGETFYMIVGGTVDVLQESIDPKSGEKHEKKLVQMFQGHYFGELALLYDEPRNASVRATDEVQCMVISKEDFSSCVNEKKFQEVLEEVVYQRTVYREQRELQAKDEHAKHHRRHRSSRSGNSSEDWKCNSGSGLGSQRKGSPLLPSLKRQSFRETLKVVKRKLDNGTLIINKFEILSELGKGSYGTVHLCRDQETGHEYAMKVIQRKRKGQRPGQRLAETIRREVAVMKKLRHPNIVTLWEVIDDPRAQQLYMIQDYMEHGPLLPEGYNVQPLPVDEARIKFLDCLKGLYYLHQHGVIHGDIKPQNLLVSKTGEVKIADFGAATVLQQSERMVRKGTLVCTPAFTPPEMFVADATASPAVDVWAMGVTLFQMVYGTLPFWPSNGNHHQLEMMIKHKELTFPDTPDTFSMTTVAFLGTVNATRFRADPGAGVDKSLTRGGSTERTEDVEGEVQSNKCTRSGSVGSCKIQAHDPTSGYLRNLIRRLLEKDPEIRMELREAVKHPWVTVEGSLVPEGLSPTDTSSGEEVEVTAKELLEAWKICPHTPNSRSPSSTASSPGWSGPGCPKSLSAFFPTSSDHQLALTPRRGYVHDTSRRYPLLGNPEHSPQLSPATIWQSLTPTVVGNVDRFKADTFRRRANSGDAVGRGGLGYGSRLQRGTHTPDSPGSAQSPTAGQWQSFSVYNSSNKSSGGSNPSTPSWSRADATTWSTGNGNTALGSADNAHGERKNVAMAAARKTGSHLRIEVDHVGQGGGDGAPVSPSGPGMATSDGGFYCGPGGTVHTMVGVSPAAGGGGYAVGSGGYVITPDQLSTSRSFFGGKTPPPVSQGPAATLQGRVSPKASDAEGKPMITRENSGEFRWRQQLSPSHHRQHLQQHVQPSQLLIRSTAARMGSPLTSRDRMLKRRAITFPNGLVGESSGTMQPQLGVRAGSTSAMNTTQTTDITLRRAHNGSPLSSPRRDVVKSFSHTPPSSTDQSGRASEGRSPMQRQGSVDRSKMMNTDTPPRTPPRHPRRLTRNPGNGIVLERLRPASGASSGSLSPMTPRRLASGGTTISPSNQSPNQSPYRSLDRSSSRSGNRSPMAMARGSRSTPLMVPASILSPSRLWGMDRGSSESRSTSASSTRKELDREQALLRRSTFSRRSDFLVVSSNLAQDPDGQTTVRARVRTPTAASSTFSLLHPSTPQRVSGVAGSSRQYRDISKTPSMVSGGDAWSVGSTDERKPWVEAATDALTPYPSSKSKKVPSSAVAETGVAEHSNGNDGDEVEGSASDAVMKYSDQTTQVSGPLGGGIIKSSARSGFGVELVNVSPTKGGITATGKEGDENENAASQPVVATTQHEQLMQNESVRKFLACSSDEEEGNYSDDDRGREAEMSPSSMATEKNVGSAKHNQLGGGNAGSADLCSDLNWGNPSPRPTLKTAAKRAGKAEQNRRAQSNAMGSQGISRRPSLSPSGCGSTEDEGYDDGWADVVPVDPDAIALAFPQPPSDFLNHLEFVDFQPLSLGEIPEAPIQTRTWAGQHNLHIGVRYGHAEEMGSRRMMEDRTTAISDIFALDSPSHRQPDGQLARCTSGCSTVKGGADADNGAGACAATRSANGDDSNDNEGVNAHNNDSTRKIGEISTPTRLSRLFFEHPLSPLAAKSASNSGSVPVIAVPHYSSKAGVKPSDDGRDENEDDDTKSVRGMAVEAQRGSEPVAYFGIYDGHGGDVVAETLHQHLHKLVIDQGCFPVDIPKAIEMAFYKMDIACLDVQFRRLQYQRGLLLSPPGSPSELQSIGSSSFSPTTMKTDDTPMGADGKTGPNGGVDIAAKSKGRDQNNGEKAGSFPTSTGEGFCGTRDEMICDARNRRLSGATATGIGGSTAVIAIMTVHGDETVIYAANVGDCRAVLCRRGVAIDLTSDHRPSRHDEMLRVKAAGGYISRERLNGMLGVTRGFGDIGFKEYPPAREGGLWENQQLTSKPEINVVPVQPEDDFLVLACDGIWDVMSSQQAVTYIHRRLIKHHDVQRASHELCKTSSKMGGSDNCSCVVVCLNQVKRQLSFSNQSSLMQHHSPGTTPPGDQHVASSS